MHRLESRWDRRQAGTERLSLTSDVAIDARASEVWSFVLAPESSLLTGDGVIRSFRVPGTPTESVGEQQCIVSEVDGQLTAHIAELVAVEPTCRLVTRWLTVPGDYTTTSVVEERGASGSVLSCSLEVEVAAGAVKQIRPLLQAQLDAAMRRVRAALEAGVRFPSQREEGE